MNPYVCTCINSSRAFYLIAGIHIFLGFAGIVVYVVTREKFVGRRKETNVTTTSFSARRLLFSLTTFVDEWYVIRARDNIKNADEYILRATWK